MKDKNENYHTISNESFENSIINLDNNLKYDENYIWSKDHIDVDELIEEDFTLKNKDYILYQLFILIDSYIKLRELHDHSLKILISYINSYNILRIKYLELKRHMKKLETEIEEKNRELSNFNNIEEMAIIRNNDMINNFDIYKYNSSINTFKYNLSYLNIDFLNNENFSNTCSNCSNELNEFSKKNNDKQNLIEKIDILSKNLKEKEELLSLLNIEKSKINLLLKHKENELNKIKLINKSISYKNLNKKGYIKDFQYFSNFENKNIELKNCLNFEINNSLNCVNKEIRNIKLNKYYFKLKRKRFKYHKNCLRRNKEKIIFLKIENYSFEIFANKQVTQRILINPLSRESYKTQLLNEKSGNCLDYFLKDLSFDDLNFNNIELEVKLTKEFSNIDKKRFSYEISSFHFFILSQSKHLLNPDEHFKEAKSIYNKFFKKNLKCNI